MNIRDVNTLDTTGQCIQWLIDKLIAEYPETPVWMRSVMLEKTIQVYAFKSGRVRFSEPFGSMEFFLDMDENGKLSVMDASKRSEWKILSDGMAICTGIDNPRMSDCLATFRAIAMEVFMPGITAVKNFLHGKEDDEG